MFDLKSLPPIILTRPDCERLEQLARASMGRFPRTASYLAREVSRAQVVDNASGHQSFVCMGSTVSYRDNATGVVREVAVVYPHEADVAANKISVLTPIGAALIGLSPGQSIEWASPTGDARSLTVLTVGDGLGDVG
jgi:regulator of nucleoside diphosphate kinase